MTGAAATARRPAGDGGWLRHATVGDLTRAYAAGDLSPTEAVAATLDLVDELDGRLHAFVTVAGEQAMAEAAEAERRIAALGNAAWDRRPLLGVPVTVKDLVATKGLRTTRGSLLREHWVPDFDAPVVERLRAAGAVVIGKTTTSEGGWSATTVNRVSPTTVNPWDPSRTAGGSSGGAAAATAAGLGVAGIGTDGAGSIRIPAAFCGVVGLKPSFGRIPYFPLSSEGLSHLGPLTRTVDDAALLLRVLAGPDWRDPTSIGWTDQAPPAGPLRIGWLPATGALAPEPDVLREASAAVAALAELGHVVEEIDPPFEDPYPALVTILASADAAGHAGDLDRVRHLIDQDRLAVVEHGLGLRAVDLALAVDERARVGQALRRRMEDLDLLAMPTVPIGPFAADLVQPPGDDRPLSWLAWAPHTYPFNLTGQPAISVPAGTTSDGLPVGLQLVGGWHADHVVLRAARELESARPWRDRLPPPPDRPTGRTDDRR